MILSDHISRVIFGYAAKIGAAQDLDAKAKQLWTKVAHGIEAIHMPLGHGLVGACVERNEAIVVNDTTRDERFHNRVDAASGYVTKSVLALPLRGLDGKPIGALQVLNKPDGFSPEDVDLLGLSSAYSASALETQGLRV